MKPAVILLAVAAALLPVSGEAADGSLVASQLISGGTVILEGDVRETADSIDGALNDVADAVGREARKTIYSGRPIMPGDLRAASLVHRNDIVTLRFLSGPLNIRTEGRALARGGEGDRIAVMNLKSRTVIHGRVTGPGIVEVTR